GSRLQAWLAPRVGGGPVALTLTGSGPRPADEQANAQAPFTVPPLTPIGLARPTTEPGVQAREGWRLQPQPPGPFLPRPATDWPGVHWSGLATAPGPAVFSLHPARGQARGDVVTTVEISGRQLGFGATVDVEAVPGAGSDATATILLELRRATGE